jgi:glycine dehydrogenase
MLRFIRIGSLDELVEKSIPSKILDPTPLGLPAIKTESEVLQHLRGAASQNQILKCFIGKGYSSTITPPVILRNVLENPGWYTAYTPYQAEISQGRLEALLNYQTMIIDLTGMEIANASLLDEPTAAAEAMSLSFAVQSRLKRKAFGVAAECHPQTIEVIQTRARPLGIDVVVLPAHQMKFDGSYFGILLQYPATDGLAKDYTYLIQRAHDDNTLVTVAADLLALVLLTPPGEFGADIVVGSSQRFGVPPGFGGPSAAFFATKESLKRHVPGRMVGVSKDIHGRNALRLALQTREQHIRREKATSNICTAQVLLANMAGLYAAYHGPNGLRRIALRVHRLAAILAEGLRLLGFSVVHRNFFDTVAVRIDPSERKALLARAVEADMNLGVQGSDLALMALAETTTAGDVENLWETFAGRHPGFEVADLEGAVGTSIPDELLRTSDLLNHPVFNSYHSETEMLRYLQRLQEKDLSLTKSMIPLGSCTMKLNAAAEMIPITFPGFAEMHPFAPLDQAEGYLSLIHELEGMLAKITGFAAASVQPNAGSQGEYTGLLVIHAYHESRGQGHRNICLIPSSAHGTNPASAAMAGMKVVVVSCDDDGNIDVEDLRTKSEQHRDSLAALMITYPSTHGVFEEAIVEICQIIHDHGGQVYLDGANLNALVGLCLPGTFGPDVAHLNLHKTFCIPHGGGGPGVGPVAVGNHLAKFLPSHPVVPEAGPGSGVGAVSAAPWGSAGILPISWAYISLMGSDGLKKASQVAILNANYIARRLEAHYDVLYRGRNAMVAHECIIDLRPLRQHSGIEVDDVAKRLMDYGFHAPTMSWPVPGTLMIEPTESESKAELDRFCDALIEIRREIQEIEDGTLDAVDNPLRNAPHTIEELAGDWRHSYSRQQAVFPLPWVKERKFWSPVGRVDNAFGDRNFVCACPPMEAWEDPAT